MKVAVASEGKEIDSNVSSMGGRAPYYLVFEGGNLIETIKNPFAVGGGGAGWSVAYMLADKGVNLVVSVKIGPKMEDALKERGLDFKSFSGKVSDALKEV